MMAQGYFGAAVFIFCIILGVGRMLHLANTLGKRTDVLFVYCLLGAFIAVSFTLTTVYLAQPMVQLFFIILGWAQSITGVRKQSVSVQLSERVFV
jgi:Na+/H+-dicarboxylate symporter